MKEETSIDSYSENKVHPLVSVILPMKNAADTVSKAIDSIIHQSYPNLEIIIINDHSTDTSSDIVGNYDDKRIKIVNNNDVGIAAALNTGIAIASGKYIARMDADDVSHKDRIEKQVRFLEDNSKVGVVSCLVNHISHTNHQEGYRLHVDWINSITEPTDHYLNRFADATVAHPSVLFRRELIEKYGNYNTGSVPEDFEFWLRLMSQGVRFAKVPEVLFDWHDTPTRASRELVQYEQEAFFRVKAQYFAQWWSEKSFNKDLWIWGFGKNVFRKSQPLNDLGIKITGYIDLNERDNTTRNVKSYREIPHINGFYLVYVSDRIGKRNIINYLEKQKLIPGGDFLIMA
ncbi:MAG: glycosyltransferase [Bacteroidota bacterium]